MLYLAQGQHAKEEVRALFSSYFQICMCQRSPGNLLPGEIITYLSESETTITRRIVRQNGAITMYKFDGGCDSGLADYMTEHVKTVHVASVLSLIYSSSAYVGPNGQPGVCASSITMRVWWRQPSEVARVMLTHRGVICQSLDHHRVLCRECRQRRIPWARPSVLVVCSYPSPTMAHRALSLDNVRT